MARSGESRAQANKRIRQEALREQLAAQGHVQHAVDLLGKIKDLQGESETADFDLKKYKTAFDGHIRLVDKYLPTDTVTQIEGTGDDGQLEITITKTVVNAGEG